MVDKHDRVIHEVLQYAQGASLRRQTDNKPKHKKTHVVIMSNGAFGGIYKKLVEQLEANQAKD